MLELADGVGGEALCVFLLLLDLLDGDELRGIGARVAQVDDGVGSFTELLAFGRVSAVGSGSGTSSAYESGKAGGREGGSTFDVFPPLLHVQFLSQVHGGSLRGLERLG